MPRANRHSCLVTSGTSPIYAAASSSRSSGSIAFLRHPPLRIGAPFKASRADADSKFKGSWFYNFDWVKISIVIQFEEFFIPLFSKKLFYGNRVLRLQNLHLASRTVAPPYVVGRCSRSCIPLCVSNTCSTENPSR